MIKRIWTIDRVMRLLFMAPVNDLSRGCKVQDIVQMVIITANQAIG